MDLKEAVTVAVALKCLILMVATQSVKAGTCFDASNEIQYCRISEFLKLTVLNQTTLKRNEKYIIATINAVYKSDLQITEGSLAHLTIPEQEGCALSLIPGIDYVLMANRYVLYKPNAIKLCERPIDEEIMHCEFIDILFVMKESHAC